VSDLELLRAERERCWRLLHGLQGDAVKRLREYCVELDQRLRDVQRKADTDERSRESGERRF
jgi:hypothetical protein